MKLIKLQNTNGKFPLLNPDFIVLIEPIDNLLYIHLSTGYVIKVDKYDNPDWETKLQELKIKIA